MKKGRGWLWGYLLTVCGALLLVYLGNRTVSTVAEQLPVPRKHCIVIDAGHGGVDGGATSCTGKLESGYNLAIALKLEDLLHFMGYNTKMVRRTDESVYTSGNSISEKKISDLKERVRIANETPGGILLSIHQNQYPDSRYSGAQVFYADTPGSREFASILQKTLADSLKPPTKREFKKSSGVYLMDHIECPGILLECGFLSNPSEESLLSSPDYQRKLCCVITGALKEFLG